MPATDALRTSPHLYIHGTKHLILSIEPPLTPGERAIVKSYGGWTHFMMCFALKPWEPEDVEEAMTILRAFAADDSE